jgi:AcrR family transcriptional regulator
VPTRKSELSGEELRAALLDGAGRLLHDEGPHALSTRRLAEHVGTSTQALYTLFGGKDGVVRAMYREGFARLAARMRAVPRTDQPLVDLYELGLAYRAAAHASPHLYDVMFGRPVAEFRPTTDDRELAATTQDVLADAVRRVAAAGLVHGEPASIALHLWVCVHGFVSLELADYLDVEPDQRDARYHDLLVASLAPFLTGPPGDARDC